MLQLLYFLLIGLAAGWLASQITRGKGSGLWGNLILGVIGAFVGGPVLSLLGLHATGKIGSLVRAVVGAIVLIIVVRLIRKKV